MVKIGDIITSFKYDTAYNKNIDYLLSKKDKIGVLLFLRYYGCRICQLDIRDYNSNFAAFKNNGIDIKIVLQSQADTLLKNDEKQKLDIEIICDPTGELYKRFDVRPASSKEELSGNGKISEKLDKAEQLGLLHGEYEGNELQLPAVFVINSNNKVIYSHYAKDAGDILSAKELLTKIKKIQV